MSTVKTCTVPALPSMEVSTYSDRDRSGVFTSKFAEYQANYEETRLRVARGNGFKTFEEYEEAEYKKSEAGFLAGSRLLGEQLKAEKKEWRAQKEEDLKADPWYQPQKCHCKDHLLGNFCQGNLRSPAGSMDGFQAEMDENMRPTLKHMVIDEKAPSKRLSGETLDRMWEESDDDYHPEDLAPWLQDDEVTCFLRRQRWQAAKQTKPIQPTFRDLLLESIHSKSLLKSSASPIRNAKSKRDTPRVDVDNASVDVSVDHNRQPATNDSEQNRDKRRMISSGAGVVSPPKAKNIVVTTTPKQNKKRSMDDSEQEEEYPEHKRTRLSSKAPDLYDPDARLSNRRGGKSPAKDSDRMNPGYGPNETASQQATSTTNDSSEIQSSRVRPKEVTRGPVKSKNRIKAALQRKFGYAQKQPQYQRKPAGKDYARDLERAKAALRMQANTGRAQTPSEPLPRQATIASNEGKRSTKHGRNSLTTPCTMSVFTKDLKSARKTKAKEQKGAPPSWLSSFLSQPLWTRSKGCQHYCELGEDGGDLTHQPRRSHRMGRSW